MRPDPQPDPAAAGPARPAAPRPARRYVHRHYAVSRLAHWTWAAAVLFLVGSGLQIFNAHPRLEIGAESGHDYDNAILVIGARATAQGLIGETRLFGARFDTTGVLGLSQGQARAFPAAVTIPAGQSLATGRVVHFFFAWILVAMLALWLAAGLATGHIRRNLIPTRADLRALPRALADHLRLRFHHGRGYNVLQKLAYGAVMFGLFPLIVATGLAMSPAVNAAAPWLPDLLGGRQTARTLHFLAMLGIVAFLAVHLAMILLAGPVRELVAMLTGWVRVDPGPDDPDPTPDAARETPR